MKKHKATSNTIRRSVALPRRLIEEINRLAPADAAQNLNRLVVTALEQYVTCQRRVKLEEAMAEMASDPAIRRQVKSMNKAFARTERDGLP